MKITNLIFSVGILFCACKKSPPKITQTSAPSRLSLQISNPRDLKVGDYLKVSGTVTPGPEPVQVRLRLMKVLSNDSETLLCDETLTPDVQNNFVRRYRVRDDARQDSCDVTSGEIRLYYSLISTVGQPVEECGLALFVGADARPGLFVFIVGGDYCVDGNPNFLTEGLIVNDIYWKLINDRARDWLQFKETDIIYFNPNPIKDLDLRHGRVPQVDTPQDPVALAPYDEPNIINTAKVWIENACKNATNDFHLYVVMTGYGEKKNANETLFHINGDQVGNVNNDYLMTPKEIEKMLDDFVAKGKDKNNQQRIVGTILFISSDYAAPFANIASPAALPAAPAGECNFIIITSSNASKVVYPVKGDYEQSFTWQFFNKSLTVVGVPPGTSRIDVLTNFGMKQSFAEAERYLTVNGKFIDNNRVTMTPTWTPNNCLIRPIGREIACQNARVTYVTEAGSPP